MEKQNRLSIIVTSNDLDRVWAALILAVGAASSGMAVSMFWAFWGLSVLRKEPAGRVEKPMMDRLFAMMLPRGINRLKLSKLNMAGIGSRVMKYTARKKKAPLPSELLVTARELGVRLVACQMSMEMMGLTRDELIDGLVYGGVATYLADASKAQITLFI